MMYSQQHALYILVPTQKMPRLLPTSATACRKLLHKASLMGIDTIALEMQDAQVISHCAGNIFYMTLSQFTVHDLSSTFCVAKFNMFCSWQP